MVLVISSQQQQHIFKVKLYLHMNFDKLFEINSIKYGQTKNVIFELDKSYVEMSVCDNIIKSNYQK